MSAALAVAALAVLLSLVLRWETFHHTVTGEASSCTISETIDCDRVQDSKYARPLGVSLSVWGAVGFAILFLWLLQGYLAAAAALAAGCAVASLALAYISFVEIGAVCLYCTGMQLCGIALAILLLPALRAPPERPPALAGLTLLLVLGLGVSGEAYADGRSELLSLYAQPEGAHLRVDVSDSIILGDPDTRNSVLVYFDFGCRYCYSCYMLSVELQEKFDKSVHFIFKHWPLDVECNDTLTQTKFAGSCDAAKASQAAVLKGHGLEALHYLFALDDRMPSLMKRLGEKIRVPASEWDELRQSARVWELVQRDVGEGNELDFNTIPRIFVNGRPIAGDRLKPLIERLCGK